MIGGQYRPLRAEELVGQIVEGAQRPIRRNVDRRPLGYGVQHITAGDHNRVFACLAGNAGPAGNFPS
jgi:hypothetical protein